MKKNQKSKERIHSIIKKSKIILLILLISILGLSSCGGSDVVGAALNCNSSNWVQEVEKELNDFSNAAMDYGNDPTNENCDKYKKAGLKYIEALGSVKKCVVKSGLSGFNQALDEAKKSINEIQC